MVPDDLFFAAPHAFFLLLALPLFLFLFMWWSAVRKRRWADFGRVALRDLHPLQRGWRIVFFFLAWTAATVALAQPRGNVRYPEAELAEQRVLQREALTEGYGSPGKRMKAHEIVFLLDTSASMQVADTRTGQTRLDLAKDIIDEVLRQLRGQQAALYAFTSELTALSPSTLDLLFVRLMARSAPLNAGDVAGTDLLEALDGWRQRHVEGKKGLMKTLVLLTDGGDTRLERLKGAERQGELQALLHRVEDPGGEVLRVFTVGLGSHEGALIPGLSFEGQPVHSTLDEELLQQLAQKGTGRYYYANEYSSLSIANDIVQRFSRNEEGEELREAFVNERVDVEQLQEGREPLYDAYFQWPLCFALLFLLAEQGLLCMKRAVRYV